MAFRDDLGRWRELGEWLDRRRAAPARLEEIPQDLRVLLSDELAGRRAQVGIVRFVPDEGWQLLENWRRKLDVRRFLERNRSRRVPAL